ncbi:MAG: 2-oxo acid dehydrogenase subunit E2 [Caldilineaceae bacterium]|nr:2-oxo acid dehydrogenase subunit E2 [Caldilineaceae bacterium]HRJ41410.1 dihydrolipoamide acetyltransferase family protein [Caldilineaceae bacterium]
MPTPIKMPQLGETVVEGTVARWLKQPGDRVERQEIVLEISTDKIDTEIPAPTAGTLLQITAAEGQTVRVGTIIGYIGAPGEIVASHESPAPTPQSPVPSPQSPVPSKPTGRAFVSPVVARIAAEHGLDLEQVPGTGLNGRVTKKDILAWLENESERQSVTGEDISVSVPSPHSPASNLLPLTAMRRAIAEHMERSVATSPHVMSLFEADMTAVVRHREEHKADFAVKGIDLTFTPYFVAAVAEALREHPQVNSSFTPEGFLLHRRVHVGVAVAVAGGLLVPVIRDADELNLAGLARAVNDLASRARSHKLSPDELQGGTFTVTNHGSSGSLLGTPIINQPQAAILGIGKVAKRAVVRSGGHPLLPSADDAIVIRPICYLSFSFDHRVLNGAEADGFVGRVVELLEDWKQ